MNCPSCGQEVGATEVTCPACGQPVSSGSASSGLGGSPSAPRPSGSGSATAFRFDRSRWSPTDLVAGVATVVLFIALFLPWFGVTIGPIGLSVDGLTYHGYLYLVLILCIVEVAYLVAIAGLPHIRGQVPGPHEMLLATINVINLVLVLIAFLDKGASGIGWRYGAVIGLIAAIVAAAPKFAISLSARIRR